MAFAFNAAGSGAPSINSGAEVTEITTESLGFSALGPGGQEGAKKLRFLPSPWPDDNLPPSSACLLSVASKHGLLAAATPDALVIASTEATRNAFRKEHGDDDIITDFTPDVSIPVPQLRHLAFSSGEDFLVISAESAGGLAVYNVPDLLQQNPQPALQISTGQTAVRALLPNPSPEFEKYFMVVLDTGRLFIADITNADLQPDLYPDGVVCAAWSVKGKAVVGGLQDGTAVMYKTDGTRLAIIPRPPGVDESYLVSAVYWLSNEDFFIVHSPKGASPSDEDEMQDTPESAYHFVKMDKTRSAFTFHRCPNELCFPGYDGPERPLPPRFSITRLRDWKPDLNDMLILGASNSPDIQILTNTSVAIAPEQEVINDYTITNALDNRRAQVPTLVGGGGDSVSIGEVLDLSSKDRIQRPIPMIEEIVESPTPLPAYIMLNHQGILSAWWIVWDNSIQAGTGYPGLVAQGEGAKSTAHSPSAPPTPQSSSTFGRPASANLTLNAPTLTLPSSGFGQPTATFGQPATPKFGSTGFPAANTAFGKPSQPAFGAPSSIGMSGSATGFGATGSLARQSPWGSGSQTSSSQTQPNPFASAAGGVSGFAKVGGGNASTGESAFSSFSSVNGGQSPFSSIGGPQKPLFSGTTNEPTKFKAINTEPSFGSTVTVGSGEGSTLPSWGNTPAQQGASLFGQGTSSFASTKESDMSDADDAQNRERDEATPTPQAPQTKDIFGLPANGFKLGSTFKGDGSAKDDIPKPSASAGGSLFGSDFANMLGGSTSTPPATPIKQEEQETRLQDVSTTPASPPKPASTLFSSTTPSTSQAPEKGPLSKKEAPAPPTDKKSPVAEDAPLPPDPLTWKPSKTADDDLPPLAGSPAIKVEAPESSVPSSPLEDDEEEFSVEEQDEDEEADEPSPSDTARKSQPTKTGWTLQDSVSHSPRILPPAPTPPVVKSGTSSRSGRSTSPARPVGFGQASKPAAASIFQQSAMPGGQPSRSATSSLFQQSATPGGLPKASPIFPPPSRRADNLRSPSPVRAASTSALGTRRDHVIAQGSSLSASMQQQSKPPTPQPEVSDLSDDDDEYMRQELAGDIIPKRTLDGFIAHQDYTGSSLTKTGHAAQIEIIYRDINGMVDTLGLNARSLQAFTKYHSTPDRHDGLARDDLEEAEEQGEGGPWYDKWCLAEIEGLKALEDELERELDAGRVLGVLDKLGQLAHLLRDKAKLMTKLNDIRRQIINRKDPEKAEALRKASLPKELADQQKALRNEYARLVSLLGQTEEAVMLLRSKMASLSAENGKPGAVPTVDAVKKTISKMISVTEKKNSEIVLLESQWRKTSLGEGSRPTSSSSRKIGTPSRSSRAFRSQSPFATPPTNKSTRMSQSELNRRVMTPEGEETTPSRGYGLFYTPEGSPTPGDPSLRLANEMDDGALVGLRATAARRRKLAKGLAEAVKKRGVKFTTVG